MAFSQKSSLSGDSTLLSVRRFGSKTHPPQFCPEGRKFVFKWRRRGSFLNFGSRVHTTIDSTSTSIDVNQVVGPSRHRPRLLPSAFRLHLSNFFTGLEDPWGLP